MWLFGLSRFVIHAELEGFAFWTTRAVDWYQFLAFFTALFASLADDWVLGLEGIVGADGLCLEFCAGVFGLLALFVGLLLLWTWFGAQVLFGFLGLLREHSFWGLCSKSGLWVILLHRAFGFWCLVPFLCCAGRVSCWLTDTYLLFFDLLHSNIFGYFRPRTSPMLPGFNLSLNLVKLLAIQVLQIASL